MKKTIVSLLLVLAIATPIAAQELTETPTPEVTETLAPTITPTSVIVEPPPPNPIPPDEPGELPVTTPETLLGQFYSLLKDGTFMAWAAAGVIVIVGLIKVAAFGLFKYNLEGNVAIFVTLVIQVLIWVGYAIANYFQQGEAFKVWYLSLIDVARSLLPLFGAIFLGHVGYQAAAKRNVPILGYSAPHPFRGDVTRQPE